MNTDYIVVNDYCQKCHIDPEFIFLLDEGGLITISQMDNEAYLPISQLKEIEQYSRMYYDLSINMEGIDAIHHLLSRMEELQKQIIHLRNRLSLYEDENDW